MQVSIERAVLLKSLGHVQSVVERRGTIPILANVKCEAKDGSLHLTATDMDIALSETVAAETTTPGQTTVPAHMLYDIVRKLPDGAQIQLHDTGDGKVKLNAGNASFTLSSLPVDEFPVMAEAEFTHQFSIKASECKLLVEKTSYAMSTEETRYYLNGIYLHAYTEGENAILRAVATDGHRLAKLEIDLPSGAADMPGIIIPRKTVQEVRKLVDDEEGDVQIAVSNTKIKFTYRNAILVSKLIDGTFPDYEKVIPSANEKLMETDTKALTQTIDRVAVVANERSRGIKLNLDKGALTLSASSAEQGSATESVDVTYSADVIDIGFNSRYLLETMGHIEGDTVQFLFNDASSPVLIRDTALIGALFVIMPMRV